jgi:hypothetical protein
LGRKVGRFIHQGRPKIRPLLPSSPAEKSTVPSIKSG